MSLGSKPNRVDASLSSRSITTLGSTVPSVMVNINSSERDSLKAAGLSRLKVLSHVGMHTRVSLHFLILLSVPCPRKSFLENSWNTTTSSQSIPGGASSVLLLMAQVMFLHPPEALLLVYFSSLSQIL